MTHSPTPAELLAIKTGNAALLNSPDAACDIVSTIVFALGWACLLRSPETADEVKRLRARVAELERGQGAAGIAVHRINATAWRCEVDSLKAIAIRDEVVGIQQGAELPEALHASSGAVIEVPQDAHDPARHHEYRLGRDLPEPGVRP